jgi:hypothetical protein
LRSHWFNLGPNKSEIYFKPFLSCHPHDPGEPTQKLGVEPPFVPGSSRVQAIKRAPVHPLGLTYAVIVGGFQARLNSVAPGVGASVPIHGLRAIESSLLFPPVLLTGEALLSGR